MSTPRISHMVYFELADASADKVESLLNDAKKYLDGHDGLQFFAVGRLNEDLRREVNDLDFHVSLHTVFVDREAHDRYQIDQRHLDFIAANKDNWKRVRVFDSNLED